MFAEHAIYSSTVDSYMNKTGKNGYDTNILPPEYLPSSLEKSCFNPSDEECIDFIFIAEFSELEGPKPLITIPTDVCCTIDLNEFAVRIMAVDYHAVGNDGFRVADDTQVVLTESVSRVYAYVHHFTLYDSQARGFVRPFCMSYVTTNYRKIIEFYDELSTEFKKVSRCFKYGNIRLFVNDMTHYLTDLQYTKERFTEQKQSLLDSVLMLEDDDVNILRNSNLTTIDNSIAEVKRILSNDEELEDRFKELERRSEVKSALPPELRTFQELPSSFQESHMHEFGRKLQKRTGSFSDLDPEVFHPLDDIEPYKPKVIRTSSRRRFEHTLRILQELCQWGAKDGLNRLRSINHFFSRDLAVLRLEKEENCLTRPTLSLLTIGRTLQLNMEPESLRSGRMLRRCVSDENLVGLGTSAWSDSLLSVRSLCEPAYVMGSSYVDGNAECPQVAVLSDESELRNGFVSHSPASKDCVRKRQQRICSTSLVRVPVVSAAEHLLSLKHDSPGSGLLGILTQYSATVPHLFYALLTSRPVVILGDVSSETRVRDLVNALWLFVPGHSKGLAVIPWHLRPLKLTDLAKFRLIGLGQHAKRSRDQLLPPSVRKYVSVLDVNSRILVSPPYNGGLLSLLSSPKRAAKTEEAYVAFVHSVLMDLSQKAFIFHHAVRKEEHFEQNADDRIKREELFFKSLELSSGDAAIVKNLSSIVDQQAADVNTDQEADLACPMVKLDLSSCEIFK